MTPEARSTLAGELSQALAVELRKPEPLPPMSLHCIETELMQLLEAREEAEAEGVLPEDLKAFDAEIQRYVAGELRKVDSIAYSIRAADNFGDECDREIARLTKQRDSWRARRDRIKAATLYAMQAAGVRVLETAINKLTIQRNGGVLPLEVNNETLPTEYQIVNVRVRRHELESIPIAYSRFLVTRSYESDNETLRKELALRTLCPRCHGSKRIAVCDGERPEWQDCERCAGNGTVPNNIPGAKLGERASHLRVE